LGKINELFSGYGQNAKEELFFMNIEYRSQSPTKDQFSSLFETTGWNRGYNATPEELIQAVANSQFVIAAYDDEKLVGFGRIVTDGVLHAMIYDMIVHPSYQGHGIGTQILGSLVMKCCEAKIRDIQLFCAIGRRSFYEKNGFVARSIDGPGMQYQPDQIKNDDPFM
jgi:GNAT superfamily N-acetyltransferase